MAKRKPQAYVLEYVESPRQKRPGLYIDFKQMRITAQNYMTDDRTFERQERKVKQIRSLFTAWIRDTGRAWEYGAADEQTYREFDLWLTEHRPVVAVAYQVTPAGGIALRVAGGAEGEGRPRRPGRAGKIPAYVACSGAWDNLGRLKAEAGRRPSAEEVPLLTPDEASDIADELLVTVWHRSSSGRVSSVDCTGPEDIRRADAARERDMADGALPRWRHTLAQIRQYRPPT